MSLDSNYSKALTTCAACCAVKIGVVHLLTARERLISSQFVQKQDNDHLFGGLLVIVLGCMEGSGFGGSAFIERSERAAKNCAENEPFFLALATAAGIGNAIPVALGATLINVYTAARCGYTVSYLLGEKLNTAFRTTTFIGGLGATFVMAGFGLQSSLKK